ncbi:unnamed protein product [Musa banksii]
MEKQHQLLLLTWGEAAMAISSWLLLLTRMSIFAVAVTAALMPSLIANQNKKTGREKRERDWEKRYLWLSHLVITVIEQTKMHVEKKQALTYEEMEAEREEISVVYYV